MGVHGLWQLLNSTGKPVPLESLEGKVLAVDVSVWLHQLSKGMRDSSGNPLPNAHLHGLFTRICKLLYYRIKPVFVFDGGVPVLKKQTLAARRGKREDAEQASLQMQQKILTNLIRSQALQEAYGIESALIVPPAVKSSSKGNKDAIFELPPLPESSKMFLSQKSGSDDMFTERQELRAIVEDQFEDLQSIDVESDWFKSLPLELQHEIITDIRLSRKNYNLSKIIDLPDDSKEFSSFQLAKLVKHNRLNTRLDILRKDLNQRQTKSIATKYGAKFNDSDEVYSSRVFSEDYSHYILAKRNAANPIHDKSGDKKSTLSTVEEVDDVNTVSKPAKGFVDELVESEEDETEIREVTFQASQSGTRNSKSGRNAGPSTSGIGREDAKKQFSGSNYMKVKQSKDKFKPVIEIDTGSDSDDDDIGPYVDITDRTKDAVDGDSEAEDQDSDLQVAIQESLKAQNSGMCSVMRSNEVDELNQNFDKCNTSKAVIIVKDITPKTKPSVVVCDEVSNAALESKRADKGAKLESNSSRPTRSIFKRKISCMSDKSAAGDTEPKKVKVIEESDDEELVMEIPKDDELSSDKDSESDDDFIEVKIKVDEIKEDEMFPASIFESNVPETEDSSETDDETEINLLKKSSRSPDRSESANDILPNLSFPAIFKPDSAEKSALKLPLNNENETSVLEQFPNTRQLKTSQSEQRSVKSDRELAKAVFAVETSAEMSKRVTSDTNTVEVNDESDQESLDVSVSHADDVEDTGAMEEMESSDSDNGIVKRVDSPDIEDDNNVLKTSSTVATVTSDLVRQYKSLKENRVRALRDTMTQENRQLRLDQGRQERLAVSITDQMNSEAQELLQLFGIPYVVSPTEAEAQCAYLEMAGLTHGTITDDSDIWLFGGKCVFKNFFNQKQYVECFKDVNISCQLGLSRESLINLALLCGSDYTPGIKGVGPVLGLEILAEFSGPGVAGLGKFREWWDNCQKQITVPKYESKLRAKLRELDVREDFPSPVVVEAYLKPTVDESKEKFSWGFPDVDLLRQFASAKLRWDKTKTDENLLPVIKRLEEKQAQRSISSFFQPEVFIQPTRHSSKRVQNVVEKMRNPKQATSPGDISNENNEGVQSDGLDNGASDKKAKVERNVRGRKKTNNEPKQATSPEGNKLDSDTEVKLSGKQAKKRTNNPSDISNDNNQDIKSDGLDNRASEKKARVERNVRGNRKTNTLNELKQATSSEGDKVEKDTEIELCRKPAKKRRKNPSDISNDNNEDIQSDGLDNGGSEKKAKVERNLRGRKKINTGNELSSRSKGEQAGDVSAQATNKKRGKSVADNPIKETTLVKTGCEENCDGSAQMTNKKRGKSTVAISLAGNPSKEIKLVKTGSEENGDSSKRAIKYSSGSSIDSDSDSNTESDFKDDSETEFSVVNSGLNIEEILSLKMGDSCDVPSLTNKDGKVIKRNKLDLNQERVFETKFNVEDILRLKPGNDASENDIESDLNTPEDVVSISYEAKTDTNANENVREYAEDTENDVEQDYDRTQSGIGNIIDYSNEGGFIREEINITESALENTRYMGNTGKHVTKKEIYSELNNEDVKTTNLEGMDKLDLSEDSNKQTDKTADEKQNMDASKEDQKLKNESESIKREPRTRRATKKPSIYSENPIKPVVKGVPWADTINKTKKGASSKGKTKGVLMKKIPVEIPTISAAKVRKSKSAIGYCNLSESDSD